MRMYRAIATIVVATGLSAGLAVAHEGHDDAPQAGQAAHAAPRIDAHSDLFELVGIVEHGAMTLYLDRYADNSPVKDARIEIDSGKEKSVATANADGTYTFKSALFGKLVPTSLTFTITAGADSDLLAADLALPQAGAAQSHAVAGSVSWFVWAAGVAAAITLVLAALVVLRKRGRSDRGF